MAIYKVGDILYENIIEQGCAPSYLSQDYFVKKVFQNENKIMLVGLKDNIIRFEAGEVLDNLFRKRPYR